MDKPTVKGYALGKGQSREKESPAGMIQFCQSRFEAKHSFEKPQERGLGKNWVIGFTG